MAITGLSNGKSTYRYDDTNAAVHYTGRWTHAAKPRWTDADFDNTESYGSTAGDRAGVTFTGIAVRWIGPTNTDGGIADVYLDGAKVATVDTYSQAGKNFQQGLYSDTNRPTVNTLSTSSSPDRRTRRPPPTPSSTPSTCTTPTTPPQAPCSYAASPSTGPAATRSRSPTSPRRHRPLRLPQRERRDGQHAVVPTHRRQ
jgi:hypothetical protein